MATLGVEFLFNDCMYHQINGVAMGSPLGPALANIFVGYHERRIPQSEWPELYHRFVGDVFSHFATKDESLTFSIDSTVFAIRWSLRWKVKEMVRCHFLQN